MIPPSYTLATLRTVLPQQIDGDLAFAFDTPAVPPGLRFCDRSCADDHTARKNAEVRRGLTT